jgi:hypothetical protein
MTVPTPAPPTQAAPNPPQYTATLPGHPNQPITPLNSININNLGYFLDGWADLIEGMGEKVEEVRSNVIKGLQDRHMPEIQVSEKIGYVSFASGESRAFTITTTAPGATTIVYVSKHGKDLYSSWRTFIHPVINQTVVFVILAIAGFLGLIAGGIQNGINPYTGQYESSFSLTSWIGLTILFLLFEIIILVLAGRILKGDIFAYFFTEPNVFDAEDITAMSLSAHKSLIRALDSAGIDITKLRLKRDFKGGRREETV